MAIPSPVAQFGRYRLRTRLATGQACDVWLAEIDGAKAGTPPVIVKRLNPGLAQHPGVRERFVARSLRAQTLNHENIARVLEVIQEGDELGLASEFIDGKTLRQLIAAVGDAGNALPVWFAIHVARCVCSGVEQAHAMLDDRQQTLPLLHHGIAPENVLLTFDGRVKLTDFGISHRALLDGLSGGLASSRQPARVASEERQPTALRDESEDLAGIGRTLYELLTGECPPPAGDSCVDFVPPSHYASWVNADVDQLLRKILSPTYPQRITSASELRRTLEQYLSARHHDVSASHTAGLVTLLFAAERRDSSPPTMRFDEPAMQLARLKSRRTSPPNDSATNAFEHAAPTRPGVPAVPTSSVTRPTIPSPTHDPTHSRQLGHVTTSTIGASADGVPAELDKSNSPFRHDWDLALKHAKTQSPFASRTSGTFPTAKAAPEPPPRPIDPQEQAVIEFEKGLEFRQRGELELALASWERALQFDPGHRVCRANLNLLKKKLNRT